MTIEPLPSSAPPLILITGASGFVGRRVVEALRAQYRILALDWRPPESRLAAEHPNVRWLQADIADREAMLRLAGAEQAERPELLLHLAAHYEFEQEDEAPYWRANVEGLRNVLDAAVEAGIPRFVFASSLAACQFPPPGKALNEQSAPDGDHIYARTKRAGEEMLEEYRGRLRAVKVRFAAMFSDYCEYPPLYKFLETWLSPAWNQRILGGRGRSAIPYLHVRDATRLLRTVIGHFDNLEDGEVLIASPDGCTNHETLFHAATGAYYGTPLTPIHIPRPLVRPGIQARMLLGRLTGKLPFERPWMAEYVDAEMRVDATHTRARLGCSPRPRLGVVARMPLMIENLRSYPGEWQQRNLGALHKAALRPNLIIHALILEHRDEISRRLSEILTGQGGNLKSYQDLAPQEHAWNHRLVLNQLMHTVRTKDRKIFVDYCADLAARRHDQGFAVHELTTALTALEAVVLDFVRSEPAAAGLEAHLQSDVRVPIRFALDEVEEVYDELECRCTQLGLPFGAGPKDERTDEHEHVAQGG
ncbi:MAG: NAD-dependent epimerase/dehydratase family protein [Myxococcales bacterium]|nr:NAD-dependent epimerase/dehydratase family protein [Myxococcales bacterium]